MKSKEQFLLFFLCFVDNEISITSPELNLILLSSLFDFKNGNYKSRINFNYFIIENQQCKGFYDFFIMVEFAIWHDFYN